MSHDVRAIFNAGATEYDAGRRTLMPCFDDFYQCVVDLLAAQDAPPSRVVDLGAGTGILAGIIHQVYPQATITLVDVAEKMLEQARQRFAATTGIDYLVADYADVPLPEGLDAIVSALSIHHLDDEEKRALYQRIFQALRPGGLFVNADLVLGATLKVERTNRKLWIQKMRDRGLTDEGLQIWEERGKVDKFAPLAAQLCWLTDCGFHGVDCYYKYLNFAVFAGVK